jgi:phosphoglycerate dehydrogenase-like enzyme
LRLAPLFGIAVARFSAFRQFLVLKRHIGQAVSRGGHHRFLRQSAHASGLLAVMKGSVLVNVARGEIVDEDALLDALHRDHLRGAALDIYVGEFERPPMVQLWSDRRVLITPHVSNGSDENRHGCVDVFCDNLCAYRAGRPLRNVIDWQRGY